MSKTVAVLAVQGAFIEHEHRLERLGAQTFELRQASDLDRPYDALVLPGGESTVQGKLLRELGMFEPLRKRIEEGIPTLATCAGMILLAQRIDDVNGDGCLVDAQHNSTHLATLDVTVRRNAYGRQLGSFHAYAPFEGLGEVPMTFIRAPFVTEVGPQAHAVAQIDGRVVAVRQGNQIATAFHPELDDDARIHELLLSL